MSAILVVHKSVQRTSTIAERPTLKPSDNLSRIDQSSKTSILHGMSLPKSRKGAENKENPIRSRLIPVYPGSLQYPMSPYIGLIEAVRF